MKAEFDVPFESVYTANVEAFEANDCPLCKAGDLEAVKPGSRGLSK